MSAPRTAAAVEHARALGLGRRRRVIPSQRDPVGVTRDFATALGSIFARAHLTMARMLVGSGFFDALAAGDRARAHGAIARAADAAIAYVTLPVISRTTDEHMRRAAEHNRVELGRQLRAALGVDVRLAQLAPARIAARSHATMLSTHRWLRELRNSLERATASSIDGSKFDALAEFTCDRAAGFACDHTAHDAPASHADAEFPVEHALAHAQLISGLSTSEKEELAQFLATLHATGDVSNRKRAEVEGFLRNQFDMGERRAELVARDQVAKLVGQINADRQQALGITHFEWDTRRDNRVRPEHKRRRGRIFAWANPPNGEIPGSPPLCRCNGRPVVDNILAILGERPGGGPQTYQLRRLTDHI